MIPLAVVALFTAFPSTAEALTADEPLVGVSSVTMSQLEAELSSVNPAHIHPDIAWLYVKWGQRFGIRADLAFAQMLHETGYLRYGGDVQPWQNNFAGIGATGGGNPGNSFPTPEAGVIAHYAHLAWYVYPNHVNEYCNSTWDPRHFGDGHRYTVRVLRDLGGQWAVPGTGYGDALARIATSIWRYPPFPIIGDINIRYNELDGAPGVPLNSEYPVYDANNRWVGQAQDFKNGRLIWNKDTRAVYWVYGAILAKYDSLGREKSFLGLPTNDEFGVDGGRLSTFYGGRIYWGAVTGARTVYGAILDKYLSLGGPAAYGLPTTDEINAAGIEGARMNGFQRGHIYWSSATEAHEVHGAILDRLLSIGGVGVTGIPTTDEFNTPDFTGFRESDFSGASIYWSSGTGARAVYGAIFAKFAEKGALGFFGLPLTDEMNVEGVPGGRMSTFENHMIYWSAATGAHDVYGAIYARYQSLGGPGGFVGLPKSDALDISEVTGAQEADFQGANIYTSAAGTYEVHGAIRDRYLALGGPRAFGLPTSDEKNISGRSGARMNDFQNGNIYWSSGTGAHEVHGGILTRYLALGGPAGFVGLPTSDTENITGVPGAPDARRTAFQGAGIYWSTNTGAWEVHGGIRAKYETLPGAPAALGLPTSDEKNVDGRSDDARMNEFQSGHIYWSTATDVHAVYGGIYTKFAAKGGVGFFGLPLTDEYGIAGGRANNFQNGRIYWSSAFPTDAYEVHGGILAKYLDHGGPASDLGLPVSDEYAYGSGARSDFYSGHISWDSTVGAQIFH